MRSKDSYSSAAIPMTTLSVESEYRRRPRKGNQARWGSDVWTRVIVASSLALFLQWGTTGAAFMIVASVVLNVFLLLAC